jgi:rhamnosyltransferase
MTTDKNRPACSLIIPTKNGGALFQKALIAWAKQSLWAQCELIIVDSGSKDDTVAIAKQAGAKIFQIAPEQFNHGATRDYAIALANSEVIILSVQDAIPAHSQVLAALVSALDNPSVAGAYAKQLPQPDADILTKRNLNAWLTGRTEREQRFITEKEYEQLSAVEKYYRCNFDNVCSAVKKSVWQQQLFGAVNFGEDIDWAKRVLLQGYAIVYEPEASVIHSHQRPMRYEYQRAYVCHRKLYALFGLCCVPTKTQLLKSVLVTSLADWRYILHHASSWQEKIALLLKTPLLNALTLYGQYKAVHDEQRGINNTVTGI